MKIVQAESMPSLDLKLALFCLPALTDYKIHNELYGTVYKDLSRL